MPQQTLSIAALTLKIDETTLLEFGRKSWIKMTEKGGVNFVDGHGRYKARYILHLRNRKHLTDNQINAVLSAQEPPYSVEEVDGILAREAMALPTSR
jgi:cyanophycinase-like exopeptidase